VHCFCPLPVQAVQELLVPSLSESSFEKSKQAVVGDKVGVPVGEEVGDNVVGLPVGEVVVHVPIYCMVLLLPLQSPLHSKKAFNPMEVLAGMVRTPVSPLHP